METLSGSYFFKNGIYFSCSEINYALDGSQFKLYEVMRTEKGVVFFLEDHLERLNNGLNQLGSTVDFTSKLKIILQQFLIKNKQQAGNVKLMVNPVGSNLEIALFYIPHAYPTLHDYKIGVKLISFQIERPNPQIKQVHVGVSVKSAISQNMQDQKVYEVLLVNNEGYITEGSRSNFFLIRENVLYSAPAAWILPGVTRKQVIKLANELSIKLIEEPILFSDIKHFEAAFMCGTSPKIMPIREIDSIQFLVTNSLLTDLSNRYNERMNAYFLKNKID